VIIGLTVKKDENFPKWYEQVLTRTEMLDYYDVSGCYILRPYSYAIWKQIQKFFGGEIEELGVEDCYFPMFVTENRLNREKDHIEGFSPEVAWVTKAGQSDLAEPIAIRPTSETVMYPYYATWIRSHRDLPLRLNQWCNVVRWEFKHPQPFLRTREFLWQEGHTAFATKEEADQEVLDILDLYRRVYEELLAVPVVPGTKSEKEKFAGGLYTTTVEGFIPTTGRAIQGATSHCLGQNFSKMFDILVDNEQKERVNVWQNSWGLTTRTIGVMVMVHGDDKGLVLPPRVAQIQVVIVPCGITVKTSDEDRAKVYAGADQLAKDLKAAGIRSKADLRDNYTPGFKYNHWELRGVPIRLEVGPKDIAKNETRAVIRHNGNVSQLSLKEIGITIKDLLETVQSDMFKKATAERDSNIVLLETWDHFVETLNKKKMILAPWCEEVACEEAVKERSARV
jgi:prolyl-tRNA synthetase